MIYIANAFSLQMLSNSSFMRFKKIDKLEFKHQAMLGIAKSIIGHADTASVVSSYLEMKIEYNRESVILEEGDTLLVVQLIGGRLPEGATNLPENYNIELWKVEICGMLK